MIEGKWMNPMLQKGMIEWGPASIGNNVMTQSKKIRVCLGDFNSKSDNFPQYKIEVNFKTACGEDVLHQTSTKDLCNVPIVELVKAVQANLPNDCNIHTINLGANGKKAAYVNDSNKKLASILKGIFSSFPGFSKSDSTKFLDIANNARAELFEELVEDEEYIPAGGKATLQIKDQQDNVVSSCTLNLV